MSFLSSISKAAAGFVLAAGMTAVAVPATTAADYSKDHPLKVVLVLHGNLGDKSFFDSAAAGLKQAPSSAPTSRPSPTSRSASTRAPRPPTPTSRS